MWEYYVRFAEAFFNEVHFHENVREIDFTEKRRKVKEFFFFDVVVVKMMMMKIKLTFSHENRGVRNPFFGIL